MRQEKIDEFYEANKAAMNEGVVETWHEKWPYRSIREKEFESGRPLILREYQNLPVDRAMAWFDMDEAITFETQRYGLLRSDGRFVSYEQLSGATIFLDWAGSGEIREQNCYAAVVAIIWEPVPGRQYDDVTTPEAYGYVYSVTLLRGSRVRSSSKRMSRHCYDVRAFLAGRASRPDYYLRCESFVDTTGDMRQNFETVNTTNFGRNTNFQNIVEYVPRIKHKDHRIEALQSPIENGWLCFSTKLPELYMDQMRTFPYGDFNDGPDATEGAWSNPVILTNAQRRESTENVEGTGERGGALPMCSIAIRN